MAELFENSGSIYSHLIKYICISTHHRILVTVCVCVCVCMSLLTGACSKANVIELLSLNHVHKWILKMFPVVMSGLEEVPFATIYGWEHL